MNDPDLTAEYLALKAANDQLREHGKQWLWNALDQRSTEISRNLKEKSGGVSLQNGRQEWQFKIENVTLVGERYGVRYRAKTLIVEVGWPRLPEHGYITDGGLARGRIGLSHNIMLDAQPLAELILKKQGSGTAAWFHIANRRIYDQLTESRLDQYLQLLLSD